MSPWSPFSLRHRRNIQSNIFPGNINQEEIYTLKISLKGGTDAIFEVKDNLASGQPCVVVEVSSSSWCKKVFNQNVPGTWHLAPGTWHLAGCRVKLFAPHPGLREGGRHPCLCTSARNSQLGHRGLESEAGLDQG